MFKIKRIYEPYDEKDGLRVLIDRLWPRGISKKEARIDLWLKEIAPTTELRKWFNHDPQKWHEFSKRYKQELENNKELVAQLKELTKKHQQVTLLYAAKDQLHNDAVVLLEFLS